MKTQGLVHSYSGLLVCRFFLGLVEGEDIPRRHYLHSSAGQAVSFLALFSISLLSILASGYKHGIYEVGIAAYSLTLFLELWFSTRHHHWQVPSPAY